MKKRIASVMLALCLLLPMLPTTAMAADTSGSCGANGDNVTWTLDSGVLTISGSGAMENWTEVWSVPWYNNRTNISSVVIDDGVTSIGTRAFSGFSSLASVTIPNSVISVGESVFYGCNSLTGVTIPDNVTSIGSHAFSGCSGLISVTIPARVTSIGDRAFSGCGGLTSVTISDGETVPSGVIRIGDWAFEDCSSLARVILPARVTRIGEGAFSGCSGLKSAGPIGGSYDYQFGWTEAIPNHAFSECSGLTSVTIPSSVESIGWGAFSGCSSLTSVTIPSGVTSIESSTFSGCSGLTSVTIPGSVKSIGSSAFSGCSGLPSVTIPSSVESIGSYAFSGCSSLTSVTIPSGVTSIEDSTFSGCSGLTSVDIPRSVTSIGYSAFEDCSSLTDVYYGDSEEEWEKISIGSWNDKLTSATIHYNPQTPPSTSFTIAFDLNYTGATGAPATQTVTSGDKATEPVPAPTRTGHTLNGWYKEPACTTAWDFDTDTVTGNITLYAKWTEDAPPVSTEYTVTFDSQGGSAVSNRTIPSGDKATKPANPTRSGYIFKGWYQDQDCTTAWDFDTAITENKTLYAGWEESGGTTTDSNNIIVYIRYDGSTFNFGDINLTVNANGTVVRPAQNPTRPGYTFIGWYTDASCTTEWKFNSDTVNSNTTIYVKWEKDSGGGSDGGGGTITNSDNIIVYIRYDGSTFNFGDINLTVNADGKVERPAQDPTRPGYTFIDWYIDESCTTKWDFSTHTVNSNTTIYAKWEKDSGSGGGGTTTPGNITVTINLNGGTLASGATTLVVNADGKVERPAQDPTRPGYTFAGWYTDASCTTVWNFSTHTVNSNTTIYAKWEKDSGSGSGGGGTTTPGNITVTINLNGGTLASGATTLVVNADGTVVRPVQDPTRPGYTFMGWYTDASCTTVWNFSTHTVTSSTTIYAGWKEKDSGSGGSSSTTTRYFISTSNSITGGSIYMSHGSAAEGTRVTIELRPRSGYEMDWLSVISLNTGRELPLTRRYSDEYTFIMPDGPVRVEVSFSRWYAYSDSWYTGGGWYVPERAPASNKPVKWYYENGQIRHSTDGLVSYSAPLTRDMLISVLYNMDPSSTGEPLFWATKNKVMPDIYPSGLWGVDKGISREQAVMILYGYARHMGYNFSLSVNLTGYADYEQIRSTARPAMSWAQAVGLIPNTSINRLLPQNNLTCGEANTILSRFVSVAARIR